MIPPNCGHLKKGHQFCYDGRERWREDVLQRKVDALDPLGTRQEYPPRAEVVYMQPGCEVHKSQWNSLTAKNDDVDGWRGEAIRKLRTGN